MLAKPVIPILGKLGRDCTMEADLGSGIGSCLKWKLSQNSVFLQGSKLIDLELLKNQDTFTTVFICFFIYLYTRSCYVTLNSLCSPGQPRAHGSPSAPLSTFGITVCAIIRLMLCFQMERNYIGILFGQKTTTEILI